MLRAQRHTACIACKQLHRLQMHSMRDTCTACSVTSQAAHIEVVAAARVRQDERNGCDCLAQALVVCEDAARHAPALLAAAHPGERELLVPQHRDRQRRLQWRGGGAATAAARAAAGSAGRGSWTKQQGARCASGLRRNAAETGTLACTHARAQPHEPQAAALARQRLPAFSTNTLMHAIRDMHMRTLCTPMQPRRWRLRLVAACMLQRSTQTHAHAPPDKLRTAGGSASSPPAMSSTSMTVFSAACASAPESGDSSSSGGSSRVCSRSGAAAVAGVDRDAAGVAEPAVLLQAGAGFLRPLQAAVCQLSHLTCVAVPATDGHHRARQTRR